MKGPDAVTLRTSPEAAMSKAFNGSASVSDSYVVSKHQVKRDVWETSGVPGRGREGRGESLPHPFVCKDLGVHRSTVTA